jgi:GT2 family glycosyltransferase
VHRPEGLTSAAGAPRPTVHVILLNWKGWRDTIACLESVFRSDYAPFRVIVCDNDSQDGSLDRVRDWAEGRLEPDEAGGADAADAPLMLVQTGANLGFTGGCNVGIARALDRGADYVFLLNNDARAAADTLGHLVDVAREADAAVVGARVLDEGGTRVLFAGAAWPALVFGLKADRAGAMHGRYWASSYATGCAMLIRRDLLTDRLARCGHVFDPSYFMYCEEVDLCLFGRSRGHRCVIARDAVVYHGLARSSGGRFNPRSYYYITRNRIYLANRWLDGFWKALFHLYFAPSRLVLQAMGMGRWRPMTLRAIGCGLIDGYRGVTGKWKSH